MIQKQILEMIEKYNTIIIHHHINEDPDCIGSQLGLKYIIKSSYPDKFVYAVGENKQQPFLGPMDIISNEVYQEALVILVDVGDKERIDDARFLNGKAIIKIDHHPKTSEFCDLEWVDTTFAAASEMIIDLYIQNKNKLVMNVDAARVLYAGLITDTNRFYYSNVTEQTLDYGAIVFKYNFNKQQLYADIYFKTIADLKFMGYIKSNFSYNNGLGYMRINSELLNEYNIKEGKAAVMVSLLADIKEIIIWIFFVEYSDKSIRVEFRSRGPIVNTLAKKYGGGGHAYASGARVESWGTAENIINDAAKLCENYQK